MNLSLSDILNIAFVVFYLVIVVLYVVVLPRLSKNVQDRVRAVASDVVPFVEQTAGSLTGPEKFAQASQRIVEIMSVLGFKSVPAALVEVAIEAAVYNLKRATQVIQSVQAAQPVVVVSAPKQPEPVQIQTPPTVKDLTGGN